MRSIHRFLRVRRSLRVGSFALLAALAFLPSARAGTATWNLNPGTGDWNTGTNWTPVTVPNAALDTATFDVSNTTAVSVSATTQVNGITFSPTASAYTISTNVSFGLTLSGTGITNNSGITQNFVAAVSGLNSGIITFSNSATAGSSTNFTEQGSNVFNGVGGDTDFINNASAGSATFTNNGGFGGSNTFGGAIFYNSSTAANGTFSSATFYDTSTAANGTFSGLIEFYNSSTAANGTFNNNAGVNAGADGGDVSFSSNSTAASGTFNNNGSTVNGALGGFTQFADSATAGNATINNNGGTVSGAAGGLTEFRATSTAGSATIINNSGTGSFGGGGGTSFSDSSTAGNAAFTNNGGTLTGAIGGGTSFSDNSTAGTATFTNNGSGVSAGNGQTSFGDNASADHGTFTNNGTSLANSNGGTTDFGGTATADHGTFTNNGATGSGGGIGVTFFDDNTTAANSTVTSNGGTTAGALGGETLFSVDSNAANATLIANGGTGGGDGGLIIFTSSSTGGTSRIEVFGNGSMDISQHGPSLTVGSIEGDGNIFLGANNLTVGTNLNLSAVPVATFSGVIQDGGAGGGTGGSLTKINASMLTLSNDNTYTGGTTINGGILATGSLNALGTGDVVVNGGTLAMVNGPRALNLTGNYTQNSGGALRLNIGGTDSGSESDFLIVGGNANLNGTLSLVRINNFNPAAGDRVNIIGGDHTGEFSSVTSTFTGLFRPIPQYDDPLDVYLLFELGSFNIGDLTPNQLTVAKELNKVAGDPRETDLIAFLGSEPVGSLPHDYDLIAPEELASIYEIGFSQAVVQNDNLEHRMDDIRAGSNGFCANGFSLQTSGKDSTPSTQDKNVVLPDKNPTPALVPSPENRWGVFATGSGDFVNVGNHDDNAHGYDITTGDVTVGVDYRMGDHFAMGLDGGYSGSTADLVDSGRVTVNGGTVGGYATVYGYKILGSVVHVDAVVGGGWNAYDTHRTGLQDEEVRGNTNGSEFNAMLAYGGDWHFGCLLVGSWSTLQFTNVNIDQFTEQGSLAPLQIQGQNENSIRGTSGMRVAYDLKAGNMIFRPEVRAAWQHEYGDQAYPIDARFASGAGDVFTVHGPSIGRDSALVDAGFSILWSNRISTYVYYDGVLGRTNYNSNAVSGGFRVNF